jgi:hypothetical protein
VTRAALRDGLVRAWEADSVEVEIPRDAIRRLVEERYTQEEYNLRNASIRRPTAR